MEISTNIGLKQPEGLEGEAIEGSILTSEAHHEVKRLELEELNLGEEAILLGKIGEAGTSEPFNRCYVLRPYEVGSDFVRKVTRTPS